MPEKSKLDELDRKIMYYWDFNAKQSATQIAKSVKSNKDTVNFRMKRLLEKGIVISSMVEINTAKLGYNNIKVYLQFQHFSQQLEEEFFAYLKSIKNVGWIVSCSGRWDALFCVWAESSHDFYRIFLQIENKFSRHILHKEIIHNINWFYYNRKWLLHSYAKPLAIKYGGLPIKSKIDHLDKKILKQLSKEGRTQIINMAKEIKESSQTILNHIRQMEKEGIIAKYSLNLNYEKLGIIFCKTFIYLQNISEKRLHELYNYCASQPNIFALTTTLGAWDLELEFEVENFEQMRQIMDKLRVKFNDIVKNYESVIITKQSTPNYIGE